MDIVFKKIEIRNFMAFKEESIDFTELIGMNLVQGQNNDIPSSKNGVGKSNLGMSLLYALFGQLQSKIKNENIINRYSDSKDLDVALAFSIDGQGYKIRRGIANGKNSYLELLEERDGQDVDITKSTIAETQDFIEKELIHCDITLFLRTMLLTSDQSYNFYLLKKADKKAFVEKMFDIGVFEEMYKLMHRDVLSLDKESIACQNRIMVLNKNMDSYKDKQMKHSASIELKKKSIESCLKILSDKINNLKKLNVHSDESAVKAVEDEINQFQDKYIEISDNLQEMHKKSSQLDLGMHKLNESKLSNQKMINKHSDIYDKLCDKCKEVFSSHYSLGKMSEEISSIDMKLAKLAKTKETVDNQIDATEKNKAETKKSIESSKARLRSLTEDARKHSEELATLKAGKQEQEHMLSQMKSDKNPYDELISGCTTDIKNETDSLNKIDSKLRYLKFAESIVSQDTLRKFIIKDLVVLLNNKIKTYLTKLGAKYYVAFDEDMDYEFITPKGTFEWSNFSAGERMRIMIATSFAFRDFMSIRNGLNSNILFLDEYFDSAIDSLCVESIINILKEYAKDKKQDIFVISHRPEVSIEQFDRVILVEKTNNIAHISRK